MKENFAKNFAKVRAKKNKCSGDGYEDSFHPTWYLFDRLKFLERSCAQSSSESNLPASQLSSQSAQSSVKSAEDTLIEQGGMGIYYDDNLQVSLK